MSATEIPSNTSSPEETFQDYLRRVYILIGDICSSLTKSFEMIQNLLNSMIALHQNSKLQMQPKAVSGSDISLSKATPRNIFVSTDLAPDISAGIYPIQGIARVFRELSNLDPHTSHL